MTEQSRAQFDNEFSKLPEEMEAYREIAWEAVKMAQEELGKRFGGIMWQGDIDLSHDPLYVMTELFRLTVGPCGIRLRIRSSISAMKYYYQRHIERHQCLKHIRPLGKWVL